MALTLVHATKEITVPRADLALVSGTLYVHDTEEFRHEMNAIIATESYIWMEPWTVRNAPVEIAGITLAQTIEMVNGFNITYDDTGGTDVYSVRLEGSNNNLFDIENGILNQNRIQVIPTNSAGLIIGEGGVVVDGSPCVQEYDVVYEDLTTSVRLDDGYSVLMDDDEIKITGDADLFVFLDEQTIIVGVVC